MSRIRTLSLLAAIVLPSVSGMKPNENAIAAASVLGRQEPARPVAPLADAVVGGVARYRLERIPLRAFRRVRALAVEAARVCAAIGQELTGRQRDIPSAAAATPALLAGEALLGVEAEGGHRPAVYDGPARPRSSCGFDATSDRSLD